MKLNQHLLNQVNKLIISVSEKWIVEDQAQFVYMWDEDCCQLDHVGTKET